MTRIILSVNAWLSRHRVTALLLFVVLTALMVWPVTRMRYRENITDFLPRDNDLSTVMEVYGSLSGANNVYAVVSLADGSTRDLDTLLDGVDALVERVSAADTTGYITRITATADPEAFADVTDHVFDIMPLLLTDADYDRIDSLLSVPGYIAARLDADRQLLMTPASGMLSGYVARDPLGLFTPVTDRLGASQPAVGYTTVDGYILSPDSARAFVRLETSIPSNETAMNGRLVDMLGEQARVVSASLPVDIVFTGSPVIAVENARCIKHDSLWSVAVAMVVILGLLIYVFGSARNIALIFLSVGWGWLFALAAIAPGRDSVSIIVIGIASVMLGIAVNYPLHLIDTLSHAADRRRALGAIVAPLVVGNVTTVGAFLCLVPVDSPALRDLGLFGALLLVGTILFTLVFLPLVVRHLSPSGTRRANIIDRLAAFRPGHRRVLFTGVVALTAALACCIPDRLFDSDLRNINYLSPDQRHLFDEMNATLAAGQPGEGTLFVAASGPTADVALGRFERLNRAVDSLMAPDAKAQYPLLAGPDSRVRRLGRWHRLTQRLDTLGGELASRASQAGFSPDAFAPFERIIAAPYDTLTVRAYEPLYSTVLAGTVSRGEGRTSFVRRLTVADDDARRSAARLIDSLSLPGVVTFDVTTVSSSMTGMLADNFNYIATACGFIVFLFLWLSMGRVELAAISFMPMAISWVWILGVMGLLDMRFNIVNIILATFIFGQGDDYTIFITEGLCYEYAYGRRVVDKYKTGIIVSALLMLAGIGVLVFATHPAMRSLGQVTVVGMLSVLLMACVVPAFTFGFLTRSDGRRRFRPLTAYSLLINVMSFAARCVRVTWLPGIKIDIRARELPASLRRPIVNYRHDNALDRLIATVVTRRYHPRLILSHDRAEHVGNDGSPIIYVAAVGTGLLIGNGEAIYSPGCVTVIVSLKPIEYEEERLACLRPADVTRAVADMYLYKGVEVARNARRRLRQIAARPAAELILSPCVTEHHLTDPGSGELALTLAMLNPRVRFSVSIEGDDNRDLLAMNLHAAPNISIVS
ncbi:MAG: MMPL family transporter [Muribaculaceae bacterium]|nr:MMPL family transporter [Muribaculaceae bacterium]